MSTVATPSNPDYEYAVHWGGSTIHIVHRSESLAYGHALCGAPVGGRGCDRAALTTLCARCDRALLAGVEATARREAADLGMDPVSFGAYVADAVEAADVAALDGEGDFAHYDNDGNVLDGPVQR